MSHLLQNGLIFKEKLDGLYKGHIHVGVFLLNDVTIQSTPLGNMANS